MRVDNHEDALAQDRLELLQYSDHERFVPLAREVLDADLNDAWSSRLCRCEHGAEVQVMS